MSETQTTREMVVKKVAVAFNNLAPDEKRKFADDTLTVLVNMSQNQMGKLIKRIVRKGRPSEKDLETVNQLIVVFLYSVKPEFEYHYASMIYKAFKMPLPAELPHRLEQVRQLVFLNDIGVTPPVYKQLYNEWDKAGRPRYDDFFTKLLNAKSEIK